MNPLLCVPAEARPAVAKLWACNAHLFATSLPIASSVRVFLDTQEVTAADVDAMCDRLLLPDLRQRHRFAGDLMVDLARLVAEAAARNRSRAQLDRMRADERGATANPVDLSAMFAADR